MRASSRSFVVRYLVLVVATLLTVGPIVWMAGKSFGSASGVFGQPLSIIPDHPTGTAYAHVLTAMPFGRYVLNSLVSGAVSALVSILLCVPAGYGFARYRFPLRGLLFMVVLSTMMIPVTVIAIPLYLETQSFGWVNSYAGLIIPTALWPLGVYVMRQGFLSLPEEYIEAARLDGASEIGVMLRVAIPQVRTPIIIVGLYAFIQNWNSYLWPLIVVQNDSLRTLPIGLDAFQATVFGHYEYLLAAGMLASAPTVLLFALMQKYFVQASLTTGLKG